MPSLVVHAGCYKTATSSIQLLANIRRAELLTAGILWPETGLRENGGSSNPMSRAHHLLFHAANHEDGRASRLAGTLADEISAAHVPTVFLSTELLANTTIELKRRFLDNYANGMSRVRVEYAIRAAVDYAESIGNQAQKQGHFERVFKQLPYESDILQWVHLVGRENVRVSYFSRSHADRFILDLFERLGYQAAYPLRIENDNPAITVAGYALRRASFQVSTEMGTLQTPSERRRLLQSIMALEQKLTPGPRLVLLSQDERRALAHSTEAEMRRLTSYLSEDDQRLLIDELTDQNSATAPDKNVNDAVTFTVDDLARILRFALAELMAPKGRRQHKGQKWQVASLALLRKVFRRD